MRRVKRPGLRALVAACSTNTRSGLKSDIGMVWKGKEYVQFTLDGTPVSPPMTYPAAAAWVPAFAAGLEARPPVAAPVEPPVEAIPGACISCPFKATFGALCHACATLDV